VGDIEPHHFQGFSGGVKSAAIGLAGRKTIDINHRLMMDIHSFIGEYALIPHARMLRKSVILLKLMQRLMLF